MSVPVPSTVAPSLNVTVQVGVVPVTVAVKVTGGTAPLIAVPHPHGLRLRVFVYNLDRPRYIAVCYNVHSSF